MTRALDAKTLSRTIRSQWGGRTAMNTIRPSIPEASAVVYDSVRVRVRVDDGGDVIVSTGTAIPLLRMNERNERVDPRQIGSILSLIDSGVRTELPHRFLRAYEEWAARDFQFTPMERIERTPRRRVTLPDIEEGIGQFWGADVCEVHRADAPETVSALLFDAISITLSTNSPHGQLNGGIRLDGGYLAACFGTWLMADHPDKTGLFRVCEFIDKWSRLRLDLPERQ